MEGWMFNALMAASGIVVTFAILRVTVSKLVKENEIQSSDIIKLTKFKNEKEPLLAHLSKTENEFRAKIEELGKENVALKMKINAMPSMKEVRNEFVSKEIFLQMEKHMDEKFEGLADGIKQVLQNQERILNER